MSHHPPPKDSTYDATEQYVSAEDRHWAAGVLEIAGHFNVRYDGKEYVTGTRVWATVDPHIGDVLTRIFRCGVQVGPRRWEVPVEGHFLVAMQVVMYGKGIEAKGDALKVYMFHVARDKERKR